MGLINFSGIASGIDSEGLISATSEAARQARVKPSQDQVSKLQDTNSAYSSLKSRMESLQTILRNMGTVAGGALARSLTSADETKLTGTATSNASNATYNVNVERLARNHVMTFGNTFTSTSQIFNDAPLSAGLVDPDPVSFTIGTGTDQETVTFDLSPTSTVSDFVTKFNEESSKAVASVVQTGTNTYKVVITSLNEGTDKGTIAITPGYSAAVDTALGIAGRVESAAQNARLRVAGINSLDYGAAPTDYIERSNNTITDVIPGVTLKLNSTNITNESVSVRVTTDNATTTARMQDFVDAYNEIVQFINENNRIVRQEDGENVDNVFGPLASTRTDDNALSALRSTLSGSRYEDGSAVRIFADLGIKTARDGTLEFDTDDFSTALDNEPDSVNSVIKNFADAAGLTGGTIDLYVRFNGLIDSTVNSNTDRIKRLNESIARAEASILNNEQTMRQRFARLESLTGRLQSQQSALTSALAGLGG
jgi:flagellar hook-associated protein 2